MISPRDLSMQRATDKTLTLQSSKMLGKRRVKRRFHGFSMRFLTSANPHVQLHTSVRRVISPGFFLKHHQTIYPSNPYFFLQNAPPGGFSPKKKTHPKHQDSVTMAAAGLMDYLSSSLLSERLLPVALWSRLAPVTLGRDDAQGTGSGAALGQVTQRMVLDATALSAIEVVETLEGSDLPAFWDFCDF